MLHKVALSVVPCHTLTEHAHCVKHLSEINLAPNRIYLYFCYHYQRYGAIRCHVMYRNRSLKVVPMNRAPCRTS